MNRNQMIDYKILNLIREGFKGDIVKEVFKSFRISNFFWVHKIYHIDIYNRFLWLEKKGYIQTKGDG